MEMNEFDKLRKLIAEVKKELLMNCSSLYSGDGSNDSMEESVYKQFDKIENYLDNVEIY